MRNFEIRLEFESAVRLDSIRFERDWPIRKFRIESAVSAPLLVVSFNQTTQTINGA